MSGKKGQKLFSKSSFLGQTLAEKIKNDWGKCIKDRKWQLEKVQGEVIKKIFV